MRQNHGHLRAIHSIFIIFPNLNINILSLYHWYKPPFLTLTTQWTPGPLPLWT
ncbi:hypothetical protein CCM_00710 [Cordyceps militaris CM01]|uniref:Uncharacterized protein n=1 Tax=Cordyceps militaris (strain CM01) TaxID=983644 RepID=G3J5P8_CORMM|nr:uncharacterized protein CCM_00710 [Cordyceps militaris CM01]EGX96055.1 hypothetical protein CCM_00710 [Cordyceps militaris CM01]